MLGAHDQIMVLLGEGTHAQQIKYEVLAGGVGKLIFFEFDRSDHLGLRSHVYKIYNIYI